MAFLESNYFESAFENWLTDNHVQFVKVDQHKRAEIARSSLKSFDFLVYPLSPDAPTVIVEVKGRKYRGKSLAGLKSMQCWVTMEDIRGLLKWEEVFGQRHIACFVFVYELDRVDIDLDGRPAFRFDNRNYLILCLKLSDYRSLMKTRSPRWQTMTLSAADFRISAIPPEKLFLA